jgi:hypothetical protein
MWTRFLRRIMVRYALKMSHCSSGGDGDYKVMGAHHCEQLYRKIGHGHCATYEPVMHGASHCG